MQDVALTPESPLFRRDPFRSPLERRARITASIVAAGIVGLILAFTAGMVTLLFVGEAVRTFSPSWITPGDWGDMALTGFFTALAWVSIGAQVVRDPRHRVWLATALFGVGAYLAWETLSPARGSPCNGIAELAAAYVGGGAGIVLAGFARMDGRWRLGRSAVLAGVLIPIAALLLTVTRAWTAPQLGAPANVHLDGGDAVRVRLAALESPRDPALAGSVVMWAEGSAIAPVAGAASSGSVRIWGEGDSGPMEHRALPVPAASVQADVERVTAEYMRQSAISEVRDGSVPAVCARVRLPRPDLSGARFFRITQSVGSR